MSLKRIRLLPMPVDDLLFCFDLQAQCGISAPNFCQLLQLEAERQGLAPLQDEVMDQLIPKSVVHGFLRDLAASMQQALIGICPSEE